MTFKKKMMLLFSVFAKKFQIFSTFLVSSIFILEPNVILGSPYPIFHNFIMLFLYTELSTN
jgi:hypothetical protein